MRHRLFAAAVAILLLTGTAVFSGTASAAPPPPESGVSCASVNSTYVGSPAGGVVQSRHLYGRTCETVSSGKIKASVSWHIPSPTGTTHIAYGSVQWQIWDCTTGTVKLNKALDYGNSKARSGSSSVTITVTKGHQYRPRITGTGNVYWDGINFKYSGVIGGIYAHRGIQPFNAYGGCVGA